MLNKKVKNPKIITYKMSISESNNKMTLHYNKFKIIFT